MNLFTTDHSPRRMLRGALTGLVCTGALVLTAGAAHPAAAGDHNDPQGDVGTKADHEMYTNDQSWPYDPAGHMWFNEYGDVVTLCDNDADGQSVYLIVNASSNKPYTISAAGEGNCTTRKAAHGGKFNLPENKYIRFEIYAKGNEEKSYAWAEWHNDN